MSRRSSAAAAAQLHRDAPIFAALGHETRLRLVARLGADGPTSIAQLTSGAGVTRQAITKHLRILEDAGLVRSARQGRESSWKLQQGSLDEARRSLDRISQQWASTLERLDAYVSRRDG
jgi:DNA-binding transcriptional ArsR family regulator